MTVILVVIIKRKQPYLANEYFEDGMSVNVKDTIKADLLVAGRAMYYGRLNVTYEREHCRQHHSKEITMFSKITAQGNHSKEMTRDIKELRVPRCNMSE